MMSGWILVLRIGSYQRFYC